MSLLFTLSFLLKSFENISSCSIFYCDQFGWFHQPENHRDCWKQSLRAKYLGKSSGVEVVCLKCPLGF